MQQIKIFTGLEDQPEELETLVNAWLRENDVRVVQIFGNVAPQAVLRQADGQRILMAEGGGRRFAPSDVLIVVVYEGTLKAPVRSGVTASAAAETQARSGGASGGGGGGASGGGEPPGLAE